MNPDEIRDNFFALLPSAFTGELLFDQMTDLVFFIKDIEGRYVVVNQALVKRCGYRVKDEIVGKTTDQVYPKPFGEQYRLQDQNILQQDRPIINQLELQLDSPCKPCWCLTTKVPIHNDNNNVIGLSGISKDLRATDEKNIDFPAIANAVTFIDDNFTSHIRISQISHISQMSEYQLEKRFQMVFGLTVGQFIQKKRIESALWRLSKTDDNLAGIALKCGYSDQSSFSRNFKNALGITPMQYKRLMKNKS